MRFIVTTDSGCDLPRSLLEQRGIIPCMMNYSMDGELCTDTMEQSDCHDFYEKMRAGSCPKTSQFNPTQFEEFWRPLLTQGLPIVRGDEARCGDPGGLQRGCQVIEGFLIAFVGELPGAEMACNGLFCF